MESTGLELILNDAEGTLQMAFTENGMPLCFQEWHTPNRATEILAPALEQMCNLMELSLDSLRRIACVVGPGSFTGIRLVLSTAAALRRGTGAYLAALDYLQALATSASIARGLLYPARIIVLTHARRQLVHYQSFISYGPQIPASPEAPVSLVSPDEALRLISASPCYVCGSGIARNPGQFSLPRTGRGPDGAPDAILLTDLTRPSLSALCLMARHGDFFPADLEPVYVRPCDAVDNLNSANGPDNPREKLAKLLGRPLPE